jgi:hypothetical protein
MYEFLFFFSIMATENIQSLIFILVLIFGQIFMNKKTMGLYIQIYIPLTTSM